LQHLGRPLRRRAKRVARAILALVAAGSAPLVLKSQALAGPAEGLGTSSPGAAATATANAKAKDSTETSTLPGWMKRFAGSNAELGSYVGSGSFYSSGYHDNYVSASLYVRPTLDLGTRFKLAATARLYFEEELTLPDNPNGRRFSPADAWLSLVARNLHTFETPKLVVGGIARVILPLSYESRYANLLAGFSAGLTLSREFDLGGDPSPDKHFKLSVMLMEIFTKYVHTDEVPGNEAGTSSGCRATGPSGVSAVGGQDPGASAADRCGGPLNSSYGLRHAGVVALTRGKLGLSLTLLIDNSFRYRIPPDPQTPDHAVDRGRSDLTWGIVAFSYSLDDHLAIGVGLSSLQPALDAQSRNLRFPFFDFSGGTANNFTQAFASLSGTL
jgi:hypothetical protein